MQQKIIVWSLCFVLLVLGIHREKIRIQTKSEKIRMGRFQKWLHKKEDLCGSDYINSYINGLNKNPLLKSTYKSGEQFEGELKFGKAILEYKKCLRYPKTTDENKIASNIIIGNCQYHLNKIEEAERYYLEALKISRSVKNKKEKIKARAVIFANLCILHTDQKKLRKALKNNKKARKIGHKIGYEQIISSTVGCTGHIYYIKCEYDKALKYHNLALDINKEMDHQKGIANDLCNIGIAYIAQSHYDAALRVLKESLDIQKGIGHKQGVVRTLDNLAVLYSLRGIPHEELKYAKEAFQIKKETENKKYLSDALSNMGNIYTKLCRFDEALKYHEKALLINRKIEYKKGIARALGNIGLLYLELGKKDKSLICLNNALKIFNETGG